VAFIADRVNIARAYALLVVHQSLARRMILA
jgi:hypothetical protein